MFLRFFSNSVDVMTFCVILKLDKGADHQSVFTKIQNEVPDMKFRREGKQLDTETATILYKCRTFSIMKNNNNAIFYIQKLRGKDPEKNRSYIVRIISEEEARRLVKEKDPSAEFRVFEKQSYDIRVQLDERQNALLFEMAYERSTDKKKMLMEIIEKTLQDYEKKKVFVTSSEYPSRKKPR